MKIYELVAALSLFVVHPSFAQNNCAVMSANVQHQLEKINAPHTNQLQYLSDLEKSVVDIENSCCVVSTTTLKEAYQKLHNFYEILIEIHSTVDPRVYRTSNAQRHNLKQKSNEYQIKRNLLNGD